MSASSEIKFMEGVSDLTRRIILPTISAWLTKNKGVTVSVEELASSLSLPPAQAPPTPLSNVSLPSFNGSAPSAAAASRGRRPAGGERTPCSYILTRGDNQGKPCGRTSTIGSEFCSTHNKSKAVKGASADGKKGMKSPSIPGAKNQESQAAPSNGQTGIKVKKIKGKEGYFREINTNIVIQQLEVGLAAVGIMEPETVEADGNDFRPLNPDEIKTALSLGLTVPTEDGSVPTTPSSQTQAPSSHTQAHSSHTQAHSSHTQAQPQIPTQTSSQAQSLPKIPTQTSSQAPTQPQMPSLPQMPSIPPMPTRTQIPSMNGSMQQPPFVGDRVTTSVPTHGQQGFDIPQLPRLSANN